MVDLQECFKPSVSKDKLEGLSHFQQTSSIVDYLEKFEDLLNEVDRKMEETLITFFIGGLKPDIKSKLKVARPTTLHQAFTIVKSMRHIWDVNRALGDLILEQMWGQEVKNL